MGGRGFEPPRVSPPRLLAKLGERGFEPLPLSGQPPKGCASTSSATRPHSAMGVARLPFRHPPKPMGAGRVCRSATRPNPANPFKAWAAKESAPPLVRHRPLADPLRSATRCSCGARFSLFARTSSYSGRSSLRFLLRTSQSVGREGIEPSTLGLRVPCSAG